MVLVDCGCDLHGYVSDVTRTWPVSGRHSVLVNLKLEVIRYKPRN